MPLFFLLSGFSLTLGYGRTKYRRATLCCGPCAATEGAGCCSCRKKQRQGSDDLRTPGRIFLELFQTKLHKWVE